MLNYVWLADRYSIGVAGPFEHDGPDLRQHTLTCSAAYPPFLHDNSALFLDLIRIERDVMCPVFEDQQRLVHSLRFIGGNLEHVDRLVKAGVGIQIGAEAHSQRLDELHKLLLWKGLGAV